LIFDLFKFIFSRFLFLAEDAEVLTLSRLNGVMLMLGGSQHSSGEAEVTKLDYTIRVDQNVLWLDVSVHDPC